MKTYDAIIIGFGKGGKTLAVDLANRGWKVAMIERSDKMYGGTCINIGCIPTKTLVHQAKEISRQTELSFEEKQWLYRRAIEKKEAVVTALRQKNYQNLANHESITVYTGTGSFVSSDQVLVEMENESLTLQAGHIFINTGATTVIPPIAGIQENPYVYTSTSVMELTALPPRMVIVGGGYIGLEFASMFASFGTQVTVLEGYSSLIPREDRDIAASVQEALEQKGVIFKMNAKVSEVGVRGESAVVKFQDIQKDSVHELEAEAVLLATGRKPNTAGLNLEVAGVKVDERGAIVVDEWLKTSNSRIRAIGDVKGGLQFTYISLDDYRIIREDLFGSGERHTADRNPVSYSVFIDPPLSRVGMSEEEARKNNLEVEVKKLPVTAIPRAKTLGESAGLLKAVIDKQTNKILGCTLFCPESSEMINTVALAIKSGMDYRILRDFIYTHPSMSEALNDLFA